MSSRTLRAILLAEDKQLLAFARRLLRGLDVTPLREVPLPARGGATFVLER